MISYKGTKSVFATNWTEGIHKVVTILFEDITYMYNFYFLSLSPFMYFQVREVRTSDDTMLTVKIMMFYQMKDVLTMVTFFFLDIKKFFDFCGVIISLSVLSDVKVIILFHCLINPWYRN